jgi:hypothetical protein
MSLTPDTTPTCQRKMTDTEKAKAVVRLRRRLENYLVEFQYHECAEKRLIQGLVDLLYCIRPRDRSTETIIDCVDKLTRGPLLREAFNYSTTHLQEGRPSVPSPSQLFY